MNHFAAIEHSVKTSFRENYSLYKEKYPSINSIPTNRACANALDYADSIYHLREIEQEQNEIKAGVTLTHYEDWVISELKDLAKTI